MATKSPLVSIIVAVYNSEKYLKQCLDSLASQTYKNIEIIVVNDGSIDGSLLICESIAFKDKRVKVFSQKNSGQTKARKLGLKHAKGEYCLIFDSDDWLEKDTIARITDCAIKYNADVVSFDGYFNYDGHQTVVRQPVKSGFYDKKRLRSELYPKMLYNGRFYYFGIYAAMWNKLFRRELLNKTLLNVADDVRIGEDGLTTFASLLSANRVYMMKDALLYHYRDNNPSLTRSYVKNQFSNALRLIAEYHALNNKYYKEFDLSRQIDYYFLYNLKSIVIEEFYYRFKKPISSRYKYISEILAHEDVRKVLDKNYSDGMNNENMLIFKAMRSYNTPFVIGVCLFVAYKMRLRVWLRKLLGKY